MSRTPDAYARMCQTTWLLVDIGNERKEGDPEAVRIDLNRRRTVWRMAMRLDERDGLRDRHQCPGVTYVDDETFDRLAT